MPGIETVKSKLFRGKCVTGYSGQTHGKDEGNLGSLDALAPSPEETSWRVRASGRKWNTIGLILIL